LFAAYRDEPEARPGIVDEILRIDTPESMVVRLTTQDTVVGDTTVPAGEVLALLIASANRDPEVFADPDTFDHPRPVAAGRHLAFGSGMHGCCSAARAADIGLIGWPRPARGGRIQPLLARFFPLTSRVTSTE
jgi:cytochrome P450